MPLIEYCCRACEPMFPETASPACRPRPMLVAGMRPESESAFTAARSSRATLKAFCSRGRWPRVRQKSPGRQAGFDDDDAYGVGAVTGRRWERDTRGHGTAVTSMIIDHRFAELGKVIGDPPAPPAILNGAAPGATIIPVKGLRWDIRILDLITALITSADSRDFNALRRSRRVGVPRFWHRQAVRCSLLRHLRNNVGTKASAEEVDQIRVEGSVLLAFDCSGFVEFDQLVGNAPRFHVCVDAGFSVWPFCATTVPTWRTRVVFAVHSLGNTQDARGT